MAKGKKKPTGEKRQKPKAPKVPKPSGARVRPPPAPPPPARAPTPQIGDVDIAALQAAVAPPAPVAAGPAIPAPPVAATPPIVKTPGEGLVDEGNISVYDRRTLRRAVTWTAEKLTDAVLAVIIESAIKDGFLHFAPHLPHLFELSNLAHKLLPMSAKHGIQPKKVVVEMPKLMGESSSMFASKPVFMAPAAQPNTERDAAILRLGRDAALRAAVWDAMREQDRHIIVAIWATAERKRLAELASSP